MTNPDIDVSALDDGLDTFTVTASYSFRRHVGGDSADGDDRQSLIVSG